MKNIIKLKATINDLDLFVEILKKELLRSNNENVLVDANKITFKNNFFNKQTAGNRFSNVREGLFITTNNHIKFEYKIFKGLYLLIVMFFLIYLLTNMLHFLVILIVLIWIHFTNYFINHLRLLFFIKRTYNKFKSSKLS